MSGALVPLWSCRTSPSPSLVLEEVNETRYGATVLLSPRVDQGSVQATRDQRLFGLSCGSVGVGFTDEFAMINSKDGLKDWPTGDDRHVLMIGANRYSNFFCKGYNQAKIYCDIAAPMGFGCTPEITGR